MHGFLLDASVLCVARMWLLVALSFYETWHFPSGITHARAYWLSVNTVFPRFCSVSRIFYCALCCFLRFIMRTAGPM